MRPKNLRFRFGKRVCGRVRVENIVCGNSLVSGSWSDSECKWIHQSSWHLVSRLHYGRIIWPTASVPWRRFPWPGAEDNISVGYSQPWWYEVYWYLFDDSGNENAIKYIKSLPKRTRQSWDKLFSNINPQAADLLNKMLTFNPDKRYTVE